MIKVPQNQLRQSLFLEEFAKTDTPDSKISTENINEEIPNPL